MHSNEYSNLPILLKKSMRHIDAHIDRILREHDIARSQYRVLYYVARSPNMTQSTLMGILEVQASTLTLIIDSLVRKGWLIRQRDVSDKRVNNLNLTVEGMKKYKHIPDPTIEIDVFLKKLLGSTNADHLHKGLVEIIEAYTQRKEKNA